MFHRLKNPLRYPNDRSEAINIILKHIPHNVSRIVSPFFAGGALEILLLNKGYKISGFTDYNNLYEFWACLLDSPHHLSDVAQHFYPIEDEDIFYLMQERINDHSDIFIRAALFYVINRCTEHGTVSAGKLMKGHPKFNEYGLQLLKTFKTDKLRVSRSSYPDVIETTNGFILCCAPKYLPAGLVGNAVPTTPEKPQINHKYLCELLHAKRRWILLTEHHKNLIQMYEKCNIIYLNASYIKTKDKPSYILVTKGVQNANI